LNARHSPVAATTYRGPAVENTHFAHIAIVDASGRLVYGFGDPHRPTLPRSAVKPVQALAVLETGALERFGFDEADLALMCASHSSEDTHIARVRAMLAKAQASEADLRCGGHPPISDEVARAWIKRDFAPTPVCSNCSGKHAGMLAGARAIGAGTQGYEREEHPLQQRVKRTLAQVCDLPDDAIRWGIDGCNLPTPSFALDRLARIFAKLADAADRRGSPSASTPGATPTSTRDAALARIYHAMTTHADLVAGKGRFCTALMRAFDGDVVGKIGAEGSYGLGVRAGAHSVEGVSGALGVAVKVEDGDSGILTAIVVELLHQLGVGTQAQRSRLDAYRAPPVKNTVGIEVGRLSVSVSLERQSG
jgi:L-asparaginase II